MTPALRNFLVRMITGTLFSAVFWLVLLYLPPVYFSVMMLSVLIYIVAFELPGLCKRVPATAKRYKSCLWLLTAYVVVPLLALIKINHTPEHHDLLYHLFFIVFTFDTGAYIFGTLFGRHYVFPKISPKKTAEGIIGGYLLTVITWWYALQFVKPELSALFIAGLTAIVCVVAVLGDVIESWTKRLARVKDTGILLPGHGGLLDRFDSTISTALFFAIFADYLARTLL